MKFGARLRYECVAEWESKYIRYSELKKVLSRLKKNPKKRPTVEKGRTFSLPRSPSVPHLNPNLKPSSQPILLDLTGLDVARAEINTIVPVEIKVSPHQIRAQTNTKINETSNSSDESSPLLKSSSEGISIDGDPEAPLIPFAERLQEELNMVNEFYSTKEDELLRYWVKLVETSDLITKEVPPRPSRIPPLRRAFREFYHGLCLLQNYVELNLLGFTKILKKHDKLSKQKLTPTFMPLVHEAVFYRSNSYKTLMIQAEELYLRVFKLEKRAQAKKELELYETETHFHLFKLGIYIGGSIAFALILILLFISNPIQKAHMARFISVIPVYRLVLIPLIALWMWGFNVYIWTKFRINYILIFGLDPRTTLCHRRIFKTAAMLTAIFLFSFTFFVGTIYGNFSFFGVAPEYFPLILVSFCFLLMAFPFRAFHRKARALLFVSLCSVFIAPFGSVKFRYLHLGDVLTSMVKTLFDFEYTICYFVTGDWKVNNGTRCTQANNYALPILSGLPLFWRLCQCLKRYYQTKDKLHLGNAGKYSVGFSVVLFSSLEGNFQTYPLPWTIPRICWFISFIIGTLYMFTWDVFFDWGLFKGGGFLRPDSQLLFPQKWIYVVAILIDFVFRFAWTLSITPVQFNIGINPQFFTTILAVVEIYRRMMWSIFRVENENIQNRLSFKSWDHTHLDEDIEVNRNLTGKLVSFFQGSINTQNNSNNNYTKISNV